MYKSWSIERYEHRNVRNESVSIVREFNLTHTIKWSNLTFKIWCESISLETKAKHIRNCKIDYMQMVGSIPF